MLIIMYAVVALQGHQYIVQEGDTIVVDHIDSDEKKMSVDTVLAVFTADGATVQVGAPFVAKATVTFDVGESRKGEKITVTKFKIKNRYQRTLGFRPMQTVLTVKGIALNG
ncbi:50S ribosomal protein L21 [Patescibacteria group bacterium]|jgi:large subunit ribosomal protein L21|nr:50S ribosomal protein L21 [Patescibacteria group bacterium]